MYDVIIVNGAFRSGVGYDGLLLLVRRLLSQSGALHTRQKEAFCLALKNLCRLKFMASFHQKRRDASWEMEVNSSHATRSESAPSCMAITRVNDNILCQNLPISKFVFVLRFWGDLCRTSPAIFFPPVGSLCTSSAIFSLPSSHL